MAQRLLFVRQLLLLHCLILLKLQHVARALHTDWHALARVVAYDKLLCSELPTRRRIAVMAVGGTITREVLTRPQRYRAVSLAGSVAMEQCMNVRSQLTTP